MSQSILIGFLSPKAVSTLTPLWLVGIGALAGIVLVALFWGLLVLLARIPGLGMLKRPASEVWTAISEGVLFHVLVTASVFAAIGILGLFSLRPVGDSFSILSDLGRLSKVGVTHYEVTFPGSPRGANEDEIVVPPSVPFDIEFRGNELREFRIKSSQFISLSQDTDAEMDSLDSVNIKADGEFTWRKQPNTKSPFGEGPLDTMYVRNRGEDEAKVEIAVTTDVVYPEVRVIPITAVALFGVFLLYFLQFALMPRLSAISLATFKSEVAQPIFMIIMVLGIVFLVLSIYIPYNTFGEDYKMLKDSGLTLIRVLCIVLAVWGASTTLAEEIDGRTALTVLSKPVRRRSFVVGKFFGIGWTTALMFIVLGSVLLAVVSYKMIYDARETSHEMPSWQACYVEMASVVPGLALAFMETLVLAALSVAISTRLPMFANFMVCFTVYVLGHLIPLISQVTEKQFEIVRFVGRFSAAIFPNLEAFDLQAAMATGIAVPNEYLGMSLLYCLLFSIAAMLLALILFEDRDLA